MPSIGYAKFKLAADADPKNPPGFEMGFAPGQAAFRPGDDVFVAATDPGATPGRLAAFGARSRLKLFEMEIPHSIDAMAYTPSGNVLLVLGQADGVEFVTRLQLSDAEVVSSPTPMTYRMPRTLTRPSLVIDRDRAVLVGEATSNRLLKIPASEFQAVPLNARPAVSGRETELGFAYLGVHALGVAAQTNLVIVSQEASPTITAFRFAGRNSASAQVVDEFSRTNTRQNTIPGRPVPLSLVVTKGLPQRPEGEERGVASLLLADRTALALTAVDYDPLYGALDVAATAPIGLRLDPKFASQSEHSGGRGRSTLLLASDEDQSAILVGDASIAQVAEMTRDPTTRVLEKVGDLDLGGAPKSLSISSDGRSAIAVVTLAKSTALRALTNAPLQINSVDQTEQVKQLQRELTGLGLNTGSADGFLGPATVTAINVFNNATGGDISTRNLPEAVDALVSFRKKCGSVGGTVGLSCLILGKGAKP